ncbi:glycerol-3-phosphate dehydrogenase [Amaricoccus macauensis]|uniref:Glycerol-3-phosphate dehydrogenase n=1 Tax=Amaricoccus macauensis TaxID=57001 RepID=A0A840SQM0_9RHOB|nr:FAD-dependent oxidoreductase [Amaricoccus macauensis]MBB5222768.1 glycerol-3-phosphate dehydrogenase [Amaricoccus macauensis]
MNSDFDVLVIGGGIIGATAGHHAASAGYDTLLVEQDDYASATSSRTSRMQNCGFMYFMDLHGAGSQVLRDPRRIVSSLELARRAMRERADFVRSSPDRVRRCEFYVPYGGTTGITGWQMRAATMAMRLLGGAGLSLEPAFLSAGEARVHPLLRMIASSGELQGALRYVEYQYVSPERIVVDTIVRGREAGLDARNHTRLVGLRRGAAGWEATLEHGGTTSAITARAVINAAGAWVDDITGLASNRAPRLNTGAKGVNLLVRLPAAARGLGFEAVTARGTPFYLFPWGELHYIGPADTAADAATTEFRATDREIAEILSDANHFFPDLNLTASDVLYSWAGVRPRTAGANAPMGTFEVREHDLSDHGMPGFIVFTGGLFMTHRDAGRRLVRALGRHIAPSRPSRTPDYTLTSQADEDRVTALSVRRAIVDEQARDLSDILRRRLLVAWSDDLGLGVAEEASRHAADVLGWDEAEREAQLAAYRAGIERSFRPRAAASGEADPRPPNFPESPPSGP